MKASVTFEAVGLNQLRLINTLVSEGVEIRNLDRKSQKLMLLTVSRKDKVKTLAALDRQGFDVRIVGQKSLLLTAKGALPRLGLLVGLIVMLTLSFFASNYLWKIEVSGNDRVDELTIIRALESSGVSVGQKKNFDKAFIEETLMELDDISAVSAELIGTTLKVDVVESTVVTPPKETGDIVSVYDAEVTRIVVNSGSAKVKIGDKVQVGARLIEGVEYNTEGNPIKEVDAQGTVFGKVNFTYSEVASLFGGFERTGNVTSNTVIMLFGLRIGKDIESQGNCEVEKTVTRIGSFFPLYAETTNYYELRQKPDKTLDELKREITDKAVNNLIINAGSSVIATTANTSLIADNLYKITVHIEAELSIGGRS